MRLTLSGTTLWTDDARAVRAGDHDVVGAVGERRAVELDRVLPGAVHTRSTTVATHPPIASVTSTVTFADAESRR